jgi:glycosyltransferase involved in cell wall biosynthesis
VVNAHWLVPNGIVAAAVKGRPLVVSLHGSDVAMAERKLYRRAAAWALRRTDVLTGSSQDLVDRAVAVGHVADARFIPYGVDPGCFDGRDGRAAELRRKLGIPEDAAMILAVGRMVPKKGFDVLLEALAGLERRGWVAVLAGEGDKLGALRAQASRLDVAGLVRFPGGVRHDELPAYYSAADVFVMPSVRDHSGNVDGLPNVVLEAMASARAVVATRVGGMPAVIADGVGGVLVDERSVAGLAAALRQLLAKPDERRALGEEARRRVLRELTWRHVAASYREAYVAAMARAKEGA